MKPTPAAIIAGLLAFLVVSSLHFWAVDAQGLQTCGQGVVIAPDHSLTLYPWVTSGPVSANFVPSQANGGMPPAVQAPSKITIAATMPDAARVCLDSDEGTVCTTVAAVRKLAWKK